MTLLLLMKGEGEAAPTPTIPAARVTNEPIDDRLFIEATHADGSPDRWSGEEADAAAVPSGIRTSTSAPGGHRDTSFTLRRDPRMTWPDLGLVDDIRIRGHVQPMGRNAFEGETSFFPSQLGDDTSITVNARGHQAQLTDNENCRWLFVKQGFEGWGDPNLAQRENLANVGYSQGTIGASVGSGGITFDVPATSLTAVDLKELMLEMPAGLPVAKFGYRGTRKGNWSQFYPPVLHGGDTQTFGGAEVVGLTLDGLARTAFFTKAHRYLGMFALSTAVHNPGAGVQQSFDRLAVYGDHGLPLIDWKPGVELFGVYAHDVLGHMLDTGAPGLDYTIGGSGSIVPNTNFVIPDLAFLEPTTVQAAVERVNAYFLYNWGVWGKTFFWQPWDAEKLTWRASVEGGAQWSPAGRQAETLLNGVVIDYTDAEGISRTAGPIGSGCDYESALLSDPDPNNPYTRRGRRRWGRLSIAFPVAFPTTAFQIGAVFMLERRTPQRSGVLKIRPTAKGHIPQIQHPTMGALPIWAVRAGDYVELMDWPDPEPFRIVVTEYDHDSKTLTAQLETAAARVGAMLERVGVRFNGMA